MPAWRGGGEHGGTAQAQKRPPVAAAEVLATVATKSGGRRRIRPAHRSIDDPFQGNAASLRSYRRPAPKGVRPAWPFGPVRALLQAARESVNFYTSSI